MRENGGALRGVRQQQDPCPNCPDEKTQYSQTLKELYWKSLQALDATIQEESGHFMTPVKAAVVQAEYSVYRMNKDQMAKTFSAIRSESQAHESSIEAISAALEKAVTLAEAAVKNASHVWAKSQAEEALQKFTAFSLNRTMEKEEEAAMAKSEALGLLKAAMQASSSLMNISEAASTAMDKVNEANVEAFAKSQGEKNSKFLEEARQQKKLGVLAEKLANRAHELAKSVLERSKASEAAASQALQTARRNTMRIAKLKAKVQAAQQQAQLAKTLVGGGAA